MTRSFIWSTVASRVAVPVVAALRRDSTARMFSALSLRLCTSVWSRCASSMTSSAASLSRVLASASSLPSSRSMISSGSVVFEP